MGQYFSNEMLPSERKKFTCKVKDKLFTFVTDNGVFCKNYLDYGTRLLLENIPLSTINGTVLDVGCGYGAIGTIIGCLTSAKVELVDVNLRAIALSKENLKENKVEGVVFESDAYQNVTKLYDVIITNPPIRAGKQKVYEIVGEAKRHLKKDGKLYLVIRKNQGAKSLISDFEKEYTISIIKKEQGFFILKCEIV